MNKKEYAVGDIVILKKNHPCKTNEFTINSLGVDVKITCNKCSRKLLIPRIEFDKKVKKVIKNEEV